MLQAEEMSGGEPEKKLGPKCEELHMLFFDG